VRFDISYIKLVFLQVMLDIVHGHRQKTPVVNMSRNTSVRLPDTDYAAGLLTSRETEIFSCVADRASQYNLSN